MKKLTTLTCFALCFYLQVPGQEMQYGSAIDILAQEEKEAITKEKHDLIVTHENDKYVIEFNVKRGKKIETHRAIVRTDKLFNKASFNWESDNKVAVKLFDMNSANAFELKVWGDKRGTGMQVEENETSRL